MSRIDRLDPVFVEFIPRDLELGKLYVSMTYTTTVHLCASGCGNKVVLPLSPAQWKLFFDGETVSLCPSVGSWDLPCRSHYWIRKNKIQWAAQWDEKRVEAGRRNDARAVDDYFEDRAVALTVEGRDKSRRPSFWGRLFGKHKDNA